jgi:hypothetical protein
MPTFVNADRDRQLFALSGRPRVSVNAGSPLSMVVDRASGETHGLCSDLARYDDRIRGEL